MQNNEAWSCLTEAKPDLVFAFNINASVAK